MVKKGEKETHCPQTTILQEHILAVRSRLSRVFFWNRISARIMLFIGNRISARMFHHVVWTRLQHIRVGVKENSLAMKVARMTSAFGDKIQKGI